MTVTDAPGVQDAPDVPRGTSLDTGAARNLATTTKTAPQMRGTTPRWLLRMLPWQAVDGGAYRLNRRLSSVVGDGRVTFAQSGSEVEVVPGELREIKALRTFDDDLTLTGLAGLFTQREVEPGQVLAAAGQPADELLLIAHGKFRKLGPGRYGDQAVLGVLADGDIAGDELLAGRTGVWPYTLVAATRGVVLTLGRGALDGFLGASPGLREHLERAASAPPPPANKYGESPVEIAAGHVGEPVLPTTFVDYELRPREHELSVVQTMLRVHTRVADLFNKPMDQTEQQLRLTIAELREQEERELLTHPDFGLLHNVAFNQRVQTRTGPPTPADMDELLSRRRSTAFFLAHPKAIAAFHRQCNHFGVYPTPVEVEGRPHAAWRGVPVLPSDKIPIARDGTSSILAMRTGDDGGVLGLRPAELPDEVEPGLNVRFAGIDELAVMTYQVSSYHSVAVLVPDALGVLENVQLGR